MRYITVIRRTFRISLIAAAAVAVLVSGAYVGMSFLAPADFIKKAITVFFMDNFGKAVIFDSVSVSPFGTIKLVNFAMSKEADFNDNIDFVHCKEVRIGVSLPSLLKKKIRISSLGMDGAKFQIVKNSSISYGDFIRTIVDTKKKPSQLLHNELRDITVRVRNSELSCREVCITDTAAVSVRDLDFELTAENGDVRFDMSGTLGKSKTGWIDEGSISVVGECLVPRDGSESSGSVHLTVGDFDLSSLSPLIRDNSDAVTDIEGGFGSDIRFRCREGSWSVSGNAGVESLFAVKKKSELEKETLVSDENIRSSFVLEKIMGRKLVVRRLSVDDGIISLSCAGSRMTGNGSDSVEGLLAVQSSDIAPLFERYRFLKPYELEGTLDVRAHLGFDLANMNDDVVDAEASLSHIRTGSIKKGEVRLSASRQGIRTAVRIDGTDSDLALDAATDVGRWGDFSSRTTVSASSKKVNGSRFGSLFLSALTAIYGSAWDDRKRGYEDIRFLLTPFGKLIPSNDISVTYACDTVTMDKASFKNGKLALSLVSGRLVTDSFSLSGYGGTYQFKMEGAFNSDFPMFKAEASLDSFDLAAALAENGVKGVSGSVLSGAFSYTMNGNRASHIVENGTIDAKLELKNTVLSNENILGKYYTYFNANGIKAHHSSLAIPRIGAAFKQLGDNGIFTEFGMTGDLLSFSGYGKYNFADGLKISIPSALFMTKNADGTSSNETAPFNLTGRLCSPVLTIDRKNVSGDLILYKID